MKSPEEVQYWLVDACYCKSKSDIEEFSALTSGLFPSETGHLKAHSMRAVREICRMIKPQRLLQTGFNLGHSTLMWFHYGVNQMTSIDVNRSHRVDEALALIEQLRPKQHRFIHADSRTVKLPDEKFDTIFIDGGHEYDCVMADIALGRSVGCEYFVFDDWFPIYGPGVQPAIAECRLIPLCVLGNVAMCVQESWFDR